jgi:N-acetylmuramoyl-L-alanine amidase
MKIMAKSFNYKAFILIHICRFLLLLAIILIINPLYGSRRSLKGLEIVVIDAGHGGKDPGAIVGKAHEKDIVLAIALKLGNYIKENLPDVKVIYTRKTDVFVPLFERSVIANKNNADLFISIHANYCSTPSIKGTETYVLGLHRTEDNLNVAKRENSVILREKDYTTRYEGFDPNLSESYIMFELIQNTHIDQSVAFAGILQESFHNHAQRANRDVRQAGFLVLRETAMPAVLIETGYLSNQSEANYLMTDDGRTALAYSIFKSFKLYKEKFDSRLTITPVESIKEKKEVSNAVTSEHQSASIKKETLTQQKGKEVITEKQPATAKNGTTTQQKAQKATSEPQTANTKKEAPSQRLEKKTIKNQDSLKKVVSPQAKAIDVVSFAIQIAAYPKKLPLNSKIFKGIENITEIKIGVYYKYYCLETKSIEKTRQNLATIKSKIPDAFIVAFKNGQPIPIKEALNGH